MKNLACTCFFLIFFVLTEDCQGDQVLDVETLPVLRAAQYPTEPYKKILIFAAPRTGTSVVYNTFRLLFEDEANLFSYHNAFNQSCKVLRTHRFHELNLVEEENILFVFTIRNPIEASISNYRICPRHITDNRTFALELIERHQRYLVFYEQLRKEGKNTVLLKFEEFVGDLDYNLDFIESHFHLLIDAQDRELIKKGYSKSNIASCVQSLESFQQYLPISGFHGQHVNAGGYAPPEDFIYWLNIYLEGVKPLFKKYGYFE